MRDVLGTDLKLTDFDLTVSDGDIELVTGAECVKQDLSHALQTPLFFWGMEMDFGSRLAEFVQGGNDPFYFADLRIAVNEVFEKEVRVQPDSWQIELYKVGSGVEIESEFMPIEQETPESLTVIVTDRG
jgi:phage baseplate assembly protein W